MPVPRFAWFVMVHHKPAEFEWLINALAATADPIFVHVDAKSRLGLKRDRRGIMRHVRRIISPHASIRLMRSRFTNWGGWSLSQVLLDAIKLALRTDPAWTHFINLSGQCYPLQPIETIKRQVAEAGDRVHVEMLPIADLPIDDWHRGAPAMIETPLRAFKTGGAAPPLGFTVEHKGSQWIIVPRSFCEWLVAAPLTDAVVRYLKRRLLSDELVMQTLAANGPFRDRIAPHYGRAITWPGPKVLTMADLPNLTASSDWFGRKFDTGIDAEVLHELAARNIFIPGPVAATLA